MRRSKDQLNDNHKRLIHDFLDVIFPTYTRKRGYINVRKICKDAGITSRTYYHWKNGEAVPKLIQMLDLLEQKGYTLTVIHKKEFWQ